MKKEMKKISILNGAVIAFVLVMFTVQPISAGTVSDQETVANLEQSAEMAVVVAHLNILDGKCGEGTSETKKTTETKAKATEGKCGEGKCGEGKCGAGKCGSGDTKAEKKAVTKSTSEVKGKTSEGKCGEGKCGEGMSKTEKSSTEKSTSKKAKTSEGKCGEGKCGVA
ncbi:MAG: hypothetical protein L3J66_03575 [Bacteroidales bacterium]|nr:hypothetical protein [Bacteroidales bacterium]